jgi:hypothetical protein
MVKLGRVASDAPAEIQQSASWRCMDKSVWVCIVGANLPCGEKANLSQEPTSEMADFWHQVPAQ